MWCSWAWTPLCLISSITSSFIGLTWSFLSSLSRLHQALLEFLTNITVGNDLNSGEWKRENNSYSCYLIASPKQPLEEYHECMHIQYCKLWEKRYKCLLNEILVAPTFCKHTQCISSYSIYPIFRSFTCLSSAFNFQPTNLPPAKLLYMDKELPLDEPSIRSSASTLHLEWILKDTLDWMMRSQPQKPSILQIQNFHVSNFRKVFGMVTNTTMRKYKCHGRLTATLQIAIVI